MKKSADETLKISQPVVSGSAKSEVEAPHVHSDKSEVVVPHPPGRRILQPVEKPPDICLEEEIHISPELFEFEQNFLTWYNEVYKEFMKQKHFVVSETYAPFVTRYKGEQLVFFSMDDAMSYFTKQQKRFAYQFCQLRNIQDSKSFVFNLFYGSIKELTSHASLEESLYAMISQTEENLYSVVVGKYYRSEIGVTIRHTFEVPFIEKLWNSFSTLPLVSDIFLLFDGRMQHPVHTVKAEIFYAMAMFSMFNLVICLWGYKVMARKQPGAKKIWQTYYSILSIIIVMTLIWDVYGGHQAVEQIRAFRQFMGTHRFEDEAIDITMDDFTLLDYKYHPAIKAKMAV